MLPFAFNSRPHAEVDSESILYFLPLCVFQLTTSRRGRRYSICTAAYRMDLSTHDLTQRSTSIEGSFSADTSFQLTTSRRGRQSDCTIDHCHHLSTHDLTQRSTESEICSYACRNLSTHDLTQRSTYCFSVLLKPHRSFNSRPHAEVDRTASRFRKDFTPFNSRPHAEVDRMAPAY